MRILIACEFSGTVRDAFNNLNLGHEVYSCDLLPTRQPGNHIQGDVLEVVNDKWDLIIAHPPSVHLSVSGSKYWAEKVADGRQPAAIKFVETIWQANCPLIAIENPVGALATRAKLGKATQYIQPFEYGHSESKKTGLWLKGLPKLTPTHILSLPEKGYWENQTPSGQNKLGPSEDRALVRAITYQGIANAMADQWGRKIESLLQMDLLKVY